MTQINNTPGTPHTPQTALPPTRVHVVSSKADCTSFCTAVAVIILGLVVFFTVIWRLLLPAAAGFRSAGEQMMAGGIELVQQENVPYWMLAVFMFTAGGMLNLRPFKDMPVLL
eukprot:GDKI01018280.1.p1 GENE.GDKI01018280.1~~GDKI01018280.1.p1  ORF type:complete len:113 (-),score=14.76 GDKI01018280.1:16-354(-)